jgi:hypothetical protein
MSEFSVSSRLPNPYQLVKERFERRPIHHEESKTNVRSIICSHVARECPRTEPQIPTY